MEFTSVMQQMTPSVVHIHDDLTDFASIFSSAVERQLQSEQDVESIQVVLKQHHTNAQAVHIKWNQSGWRHGFSCCLSRNIADQTYHLANGLAYVEPDRFNPHGISETHWINDPFEGQASQVTVDYMRATDLAIRTIKNITLIAEGVRNL